MDRLTPTLLRLGQATRAIALAEAREVGLTPVQARTLLFARHTKSFATSIGNLAASLGASHASAVGVVDGLVRRGLLERRPSARDGRVTLLRLTPAGEAACDRLEGWGRVLDDALVDLPPADHAALERGLRRLIWRLRAAGRLAVAEPCRGCRYFQEDAAPGAAEPHHCALLQAFLSEEEAQKDCPDHLPLAQEA